MAKLRPSVKEIVELLLKNCMKAEETKSLAVYFEKHGLLSSNFSKDLTGEVDVNDIFEGIGEITEKTLGNVCLDPDFPASRGVSKLIWGLVSIDNDDLSLLRSLVGRWSVLLERKNEVLRFITDNIPDLQDQLRNIEDSYHDWLVLLLTRLTHAKKSDRISCVKEIEKILASESVKLPRELGAGQETKENIDLKEWLNSSFAELRSHHVRNLLENDVRLLWPNENDLMNEENWPSFLYVKFDDPKCTEFLKIAKAKLPKEGEMTENEKTLKNGRMWLNQNVPRLLAEKDTFSELVKIHFPEENELLEPWPGRIIQKCQKSTETNVVDFLQSLLRYDDVDQVTTTVTAPYLVRKSGDSSTEIKGSTSQVNAKARSGVVTSQPRSESHELKEWLRHLNLKEMRDDLMAFIHQIFQEKKEEICSDPEWPFQFKKEMLGIEDESEFVAKALALRGIVNEKYLKVPEISGKRSPSSSSNSPATAESQRDILWLEKNSKMLDHYSHRVMIFISQKFAGEKWFKANKPYSSFKNDLMKHCEECQDSIEVKQLIQLLHEKARTAGGITVCFNFPNARTGSHENGQVTVEFRVLPLKRSRTQQQVKYDKDTKILKLWTCCNGKEVETTLTRLDRCFQYKIPFPMGAKIHYRYFTDSRPEVWNQSAAAKSNRVLELPRDKETLVQLDFTSVHDFTMSDVLHKHLPKGKALESGSKSVTAEIMMWLSAMTSSSRSVNADILKALNKWLSRVSKHSFSVDGCEKPIIACALSKALPEARIKIEEDIRSQIFQLLNIGKLSEDGQKVLKEKIKSNVFPLDSDSQRTTYKGFSSSFLPLILRRETFNPNFLLALPIYWMFAEKPVTDHQYRLESECYLPSANKLDHWEGQKSRAKEKQEELLGMMDSITDLTKLHPWILKAYIYFLTPQSLNDLLKKRQYSIDLDYDFLFRSLDLFSIGDSDVMKKTLKMLEKKSQECGREKVSTKELCARRLKDMNQTLKELLQSKELSSSLKHEILVFCAEVAILSNGTDEDNSIQDGLLSIVNQICEILKPDGVAKEQIRVWNRICNLNWPKNIDRDIIDAMKKMVNDKWKGKEKECIEFYVKNVKNAGLGGPLIGLFDETAELRLEEHMEKMQSVKESGQRMQVLNNLMQSVGKFRGNLLDFFNCYLKRKLNEYEPGEFLLFWKYSLQFISAFYRKNFKDFDSETNANLLLAVGTFQSLINSLDGGNVTCDKFKEMLGLKQKCMDLAEILFDKAALVKSLFKKWSEVMAYNEKLDTGIRLVITECEHKNINTEDLKGILSIDKGSRKLCNLATPSPGGQMEYPLLKPLEACELNALYKHGDEKENACYRRLYKELLNNDSPDDFTWRQVISRCIIPTQDKIVRTGKAIDAGTIKLCEIPHAFQEYPTSDTIERDLKEIFDFSGVSFNSIRLESIKKKVTACLQHLILAGISQSITEAAQLLTLNGDFSSVNDMKDWFEKDLEHMPAQHEIASYCDGNVERILRAFLKEKNFVSWLLKNTARIQEISTLTNLALVHVGNDKDIDKIAKLQSSVEVFSPLIYNWTRVGGKREGDIETLLCRCKNVVKNCGEAIDAALDNWKIAGSSLVWVEEVVKIFGDSGKHAMDTIQEVNRLGVYVIRRSSDQCFSFDNYVEVILTNDSCSLEEKTSKNKRDNKIFSYSELCDLQSKIMLIAGEKEKTAEVEKFVTLLSMAENLAQICMDLTLAGCLLYEDIVMTIGRREKDASESFTITFSMLGKGNAEKILTGVGTFNNLEDIARALRDILSRWKEYLEQSFEKYYFLNEYTINQITLLCKNLGASGLSGLDKRTMILLRRVNPHISKRDVTEAIDRAKRYEEYSQITEAMPSVRANNDDDGIQAQLDMLRRLYFESDFTEELAKAAVLANGTNFQKCMKWRIQNFKNVDLISSLSKQFDEKMALVHRDRKVKPDILYQRANMSLVDVIKRLQEGLDGDMMASAIMTLYENFLQEAKSLTVEGLLNLEHFGKVLDFLAKKDSNIIVSRKLPDPLQKGVANIVICDEKDITKTLLALYANEEEKPLPSPSEVLLCDKDTTFDEIQQFLRRAMYKSPMEDGKRLYCLAATHHLTPKVSHQAGNASIMLAGHETDEEYQLVVISSDRNHYLSTCLCQGSKQGSLNDIGKISVNTSDQHISNYLQSKLLVENPSSAHEYSVKVVSSTRSGMGKSLHIRRIKEKLEKEITGKVDYRVVRFMEVKLKANLFATKVMCKDEETSGAQLQLIHLDITPAVQYGLVRFIFNLLILGEIEDSKGEVWRRTENHLYLVEMTDLSDVSKDVEVAFELLKLLPGIKCLSPIEIGDKDKEGIGMDPVELVSERFQRPSQYLSKFDTKRVGILDRFSFEKGKNIIDECDCVKILLKYCSDENPSWAQLWNFASFLNLQLKNCEDSIFCNIPDLRNLKSFAVDFMIKMAQDLTTPSLDMSDISVKNDDLQQDYSLRRRWETVPHPFVFFHDDGQSMTFIGITSQNFSLKYASERQKSDLITALNFQGVDLDNQFDNLTRKEKLKVLCKVLGVPVTDSIKEGNWTKILANIDKDGYIKLPVGGQNTRRLQIVADKHLPLLKQYRQPGIHFTTRFEEAEKMFQRIAEEVECLEFSPTKVFDPDEKYQITANNVLKMMAIYLRFRSNIPVIVIGETGCGKTRMVQFLSKLLSKKFGEPTLYAVRVHGGTTISDIHQCVKNAKALAKKQYEHAEDGSLQEKRYNDEENGNMQEKEGKHIEDGKILFLDEANTTEAIYAIKEALCDDEAVTEKKKLWIIAACNPYKKLSPTALEKLERSGLRYSDKTGSTAQQQMCSLVYRVVPLPPSIRSFVWDFGLLGSEEEESFIRSIISEKLKLSEHDQSLFQRLLVSTHKFMRNLEDECKYVGLRDVERSVLAFQWFERMKSHLFKGNMDDVLPDPIWTMVQVLGFCYHSSVEDRKGFRINICEVLRTDERVADFQEEDCLMKLNTAKKIVASNMVMEGNISKNEALIENVFVITLCADMKIPLFLIGIPGSSKSLAKSIVANSLCGGNNKHELFREFKNIHIKSYQCSGFTTAREIESVFEQCMQYQLKQNTFKEDSFVSVVALDEIGLAENSPHMPLKVLHSLLESGSVTDDDLAHKNNPSKKVGFLGISNWPLDPAKLNRGIFVRTPKPDEKMLLKTITDMFSDTWTEQMLPVVNSLVKAYLNVTTNLEFDKDYFGLRDLYSLMRMVKQAVDKAKEPSISMQDVMNAVTRNFSGERRKLKIKPCVDTFKKQLIEDAVFVDTSFNSISVTDILHANLGGKSRFLLLLVKQCFTLYMLKKATKDTQNFKIIFGSGFPGDKHYAARQRNVNKIKSCMGTPCTLVILNLNEIHESLYDALNQHYETLGDRKYVELGLGSSRHRVTCRVHDDFRMIFIEDAETVFKSYPSPLINRLEKHHFGVFQLLDQKEREQARSLKDWSERFCTFDHFTFHKSDSFVGYHHETASSVVLTVGTDYDKCKERLLMSATTDSIVRVSKSRIQEETNHIHAIYFKNQHHDNLFDFLKTQLTVDSSKGIIPSTRIELFEVITFSTAFTEKDRKEIGLHLKVPPENVWLLSLDYYDTSIQYSNELESFFHKSQSIKDSNQPMILLIQCISSHKNRTLISSAWYHVEDKLTQYKGLKNGIGSHRVTVIFLLCTERKTFVDQKSSTALEYRCSGETVYVDELRPISAIGNTWNYLLTPMSEVLRNGFTYWKKANDTQPNPQVVNLPFLVNACVLEALAFLEFDKPARKEELVNACDQSIKNNKFLMILLEKIISLLEQKDDEKIAKSMTWIVETACNETGLLDAGTFRNAIWLKMVKKISIVLAFVISAIDSNSNLDLALEGSSWSCDLWMVMFDKLRLEWNDMKKKKRFHLKNIGLAKCTFPFSMKLLEEFSKSSQKWGLLDNEEKNRFLSDWEGFEAAIAACKSHGKKALEALICDLLKLSYLTESGNEKETQILENITLKWTTGDIAHDMLDKTDVTSSIQKFLQLQVNFKKFSKIFCRWGSVVGDKKLWEEKMTCAADMLKRALNTICDLLSKKVLELNELNECTRWVNDVYDIEKIFGSLCLEASKWSKIALVHMFITQLAPIQGALSYEQPCSSSSGTYENYLPIVSNQAMSLHCLDTIDLESLCTVMDWCLEEVQFNLFICWSDKLCPLCHRRMKIPMKFSCNHFMCTDCYKTSDSSECLKCHEPAVASSEIFPSLPMEQKKELNNLKLKCTSFLLKYTGTLQCSLDKSKKESYIDQILKLLCQNDGVENTDQAFDRNIQSLSCLLDIAMKMDAEYTSTKLNEALSHQARSEMIQGIMFLLELPFRDVDISDLTPDMSMLNMAENLTLEFLQSLSEIKVALQKIAHRIQVVSKEKLELDEVMKLIQSDESGCCKVYFLKYGCSKFDRNWLMKVSRIRHSAEIFGEIFHFPAKDFTTWELLGDSYENGLCDQSNKYQEDLLAMDKFEMLKEHAFIFAAISLSTKNSSMATEVVAQFKKHGKDEASIQRLLGELIAFFHSPDSESHLYGWLLQLLAPLAVAITKQRYLMHEFQTILQNPERIQRLFLPTMPHSIYFSLPEEFRTPTKNWYGDMVTNMFICPNGHLYMIDGCTRPQESSTCYACGATIGGTNDTLATGNYRYKEDQLTAAGYILDRPVLESNIQNAEDRMSKHGTAVTRFILHSCLLFTTFGGYDVSRISQAEGATKESFVSYLLRQLDLNLRELATALSINAEEAKVLMFKIIENIINFKMESSAEWSWETIDTRRAWETKFYESFLCPVFSDFSKILDDAMKTIRQRDPYFRVLHQMTPNKQSSKICQNPALWCIFKEVNLDRLLQHLTDNGQHNAEILHAVLKCEKIEFLNLLKPVAELQKRLVSRYQYRLDRSEAEDVTFDDYLAENDYDDEIKVMLEKYCKAWKLVQEHLKLEQAPQTLTMKSPISFGLPNKNGNGKFAGALLSQFIEWHNGFLQECRRLVPKFHFEKVAISSIDESQVAYVDKNKNLLPLVQTCTKYEIADLDGAASHRFTYNLDSLEKMVRQEYLAYKKLIDDKTLPVMRYAQDVGMSEDWKMLKKQKLTELLHPSMEKNIDSFLKANPSKHLYEGVRTIAKTISFLVQTSASSDKILNEYISKTLKLGDDRTFILPNSVQLKHTLALYLHLTWRRAVELTKKRADPFQDLLLREQQEIESQNTLDCIHASLPHIVIEVLQKRINETLVTRVVDFQSEWSLTDDIFPNVDYLDGNDNDSWFAKLPAEICFRHITHLFRLSVEFSLKRDAAGQMENAQTRENRSSALNSSLRQRQIEDEEHRMPKHGSAATKFDELLPSNEHSHHTQASSEEASNDST